MKIQDRREPTGGHAVILVVAVTALGLALRLLWLDGGGLGYYELIQARLATEDLGGLWQQFTVGRPPLYPALMWCWAHVFGGSPLALRLPSALFSAAAVPMVFLAGRRLFDGRVGILAALLMAIAPFQIEFAQLHRYYALMVLLGVTSVWMLLRALGVGEGGDAGGRPRDWVGYVVVSTLLFYTQPMSMFTLVAVAAVMGVMTVRGGLRYRQKARFWGGQIAIMALAAPWLVLPVVEVVRNAPPATAVGGDRVPWLISPPWYALLRGPFNFLVLGVQHVGPVAMALGSGLVAAGALGTVLRGGPLRHGHGGFSGLWGLRRWVGDLRHRVVAGWWERERSWGLLAGWALGPLALGLAVSWSMKPVYRDHYFMPAAPGLYVAVAALLVVSRKAVPLRASFLALVVIMGSAAASYYRQADRAAWPQAAAWMGSRLVAGDLIDFASERGLSSEAEHLRDNWGWYAAQTSAAGRILPGPINVNPAGLGAALRQRCGEAPGLWVVVRRGETRTNPWFTAFMESPEGFVEVTDHQVFGDLVVLRVKPQKLSDLDDDLNFEQGTF